MATANDNNNTTTSKSAQEPEKNSAADDREAIIQKDRIFQVVQWASRGTWEEMPRTLP